MTIDKWIEVWTHDGGVYYLVHTTPQERTLKMVVQSIWPWALGFLQLYGIDGATVYLKARAIQGFSVRTPANKALWDEFMSQLNTAAGPPDEPWKAA